MTRRRTPPLILSAPVASVAVLAALVFVSGSADSATNGMAWVGRMCLAFAAAHFSRIFHLTVGLALALLLLHVVVALAVLFREKRKTSRLRGWLLSLRTDSWPWRLRRLAARLDLTGRIDLIDSQEPNAFCYGLVRPRICLTTGLLRCLKPKELEAVLWHERHHLNHRDPVRLALVEAIKTSLFYLPVVGSVGRRFADLKELRADDEAVRRVSARHLTSALKRLLPSTAAGVAQVSVAGLSPATYRIERLLGTHRALALDPFLRRDEVASSLAALSAVGLLLVSGAFAGTALALSHLCSL